MAVVAALELFDCGRGEGAAARVGGEVAVMATMMIVARTITRNVLQ